MSTSDLSLQVAVAKQGTESLSALQELQVAVETDKEIAPSDFNDEWTTAPRSMRNYVEREVAEYFYERGRLAERGRMLSEQNADYVEMLRVGRERLIR